MFRFLTSGESHGQSLVGIIEGIPAHVRICTEDIDKELARRRLGAGRGARMGFEQDQVRIIAGVRHGETLGSPVAIEIGNTEWPKWQTVMASDPVPAEELTGLARNAKLTRPRPGHADLAGMQKYDWDEARPLLERASARETATRVALGTVAKNFLAQLAGITVISHVVQLGPITSTPDHFPTMADLPVIDADPVRCLDPLASAQMQREIESCHKEGDTLGGAVEVIAWGCPPGLGSHIQWDRRLDAKLAAALMGIQAIKAVEVGDGVELGKVRGSRAHDEIEPGPFGIRRCTAHAGGIEAGMTTGEAIRVRATMKPIATVPKALRTLDVSTGEPATAHHQRSDVCAVPAMGVVAEAMVALVLAESVLDKFGGDSLTETRRNLHSYLRDISERGLAVSHD